MSDAIDSQKLQYFGRKPSQFKTNFDSIVVAPPRCSIHSFIPGWQACNPEGLRPEILAYSLQLSLFRPIFLARV